MSEITDSHILLAYIYIHPHNYAGAIFHRLLAIIATHKDFLCVPKQLLFTSLFANEQKVIPIILNY